MTAKQLKNSILQMAVQGKLVPQDPNDEPASVLLERIKNEKGQLIKEKKIKENKPLPPITDDEVPFDLPEGWIWCRLGDIALKILAGGDKPKDFSAVQTTKCQIPVIANGVTNNGLIGYTETATINERSVTISGRGTIGFSCVRTVPYCPIVRLISVIPSDLVDIEYLCYTFEFLFERGIGTSIPQLTVPMVSPKLVPLPPLPEQHRIVARIEELLPLIEEYGEKYNKLEKYNKSFPVQMKKSILQAAVQGKLVEQNADDEPASVLLGRIRAEKERFVKSGKIKKSKPLPPISDDEITFDVPSGWVWCRLGDLVYKLTDGAHHTPTYTTSGVPFLSVKDMSSGKIDFGNTKFISTEQHADLYKRCDPERGDILLTKVGTTGVPVLIDTDREFSLFVSVALLKFNQDLLCGKYLVNLLGSPLVQEQCNENTRGVGNKNWVIRDIANTLVVLPPFAEQERIVARVEELLGVVEGVRESIG